MNPVEVAYMEFKNDSNVQIHTTNNWESLECQCNPEMYIKETVEIYAKTNPRQNEKSNDIARESISGTIWET